MGDVTDPLTNLAVFGEDSRETIDKLERLYGRDAERPNFDYEKAPARGWQAGKKDFGDKTTYVKWHVFKSKKAAKDKYSLSS